MEVEIDMNQQVLRILPTPSNNTDAAMKQYVEIGKNYDRRHQHELKLDH